LEEPFENCNTATTATARAESSLLELCRAPAVVDEVNAATARAESAESLRINDGNPKDKM
jgi:hypothetical protein